jgi:hypothetical protein
MARVDEPRVEITPEPEPGERDAILRAAAAVAREGDGGRSAWWREGQREALAGEAPGREAPGREALGGEEL